MYTHDCRRLFAKYAIPQMVGLLFNSIYLIVDGIFIGNRLGTDAMAAAAVSVPLIELLISMAIAIASGAGVLVSEGIAQDDIEKAERAFNTALFFALFIGGIILCVGLRFIDSLAVFLGSTPTIHGEAVQYMRCILVFAPFQILSFLLGGVVRNDGAPKVAMLALALGSVMNIFLDYVFIYLMNLGVFGAALATGLGPVISVGLLIPHFVQKKGVLVIRPASIKIKAVPQILSLGFPSFILEFTIGILTFLYNSAIVREGYDALGLAAYLLIGYLMLIALTIFLGMAEGLQPVFSFLKGAGQYEKNKALVRFSSKVILSCGIGAYILILLFRHNFFTMINPADTELIAFASDKSIVYFWGLPFAGLNILFITYWQATKATKRALAGAISRSIVFPPIIIWVLPVFFGRESIWTCFSLSEAAAFIVCALQLRHTRTKMNPNRENRENS